MKYLAGYTDPFISPVTGLLAVVQPLPDLERGYVWIGNERSRPLPTFKLIDLTIDVKYLQKQLDVILQTSFVVNTPVPSLPKAQALSVLDDGLIKNVSGILAIATANVDYLSPSLASGKLWIGSESNLATPQATIAVANLPNLSQGMVWQGNANNRPVEVTIAVAPVDARYILQQPNSSLTNAQSLNQLIGLDPKILKATADGVIEVAIPDQDYATKETLEYLAAEAQTSADAAAASAEAATGASQAAAVASGGATVAATEAAAAAATASGSVAAAAVSALGAGASAIAASLSASSASSSASDASSSADHAATSATNAAGSADHAATSATNAAGSADHAATSATNAAGSAESAANNLNTLLTTGITLQGAIYGSGGLLNPITTNFSNDPVLPGTQSLTLPVGTTAERPSTPTVGMMRFNSSTSKVETCLNGSTWENSDTASNLISPCLAATTTNLAATYDNGTLGVGATLTSMIERIFVPDLFVVSVGDRVLVKNQNSTIQNGIYTITDLGSESTFWVLTRATDFNTPSNIEYGAAINVTVGMVNGLTSWRLYSEVTTFGTSDIIFFQAGGGLTGEIKMWGGEWFPIGWFLCDGSSLSRATYSDLFATIGTAFGSENPKSFNLPDFRGVFPRGANQSRTGMYADPDRNVRVSAYPGGATGNAIGTYQKDAYFSHTHTMNHGGAHTHTWDGYYNTSFGGGRACRSRSKISADPTHTSTNSSGSHLHIINHSGSSETRPSNLYINFIIKT